MTELEWDGSRLAGDCLALTLLTGVSKTDGTTGLVAAAAGTADLRCFIRPERLGGFLLAHREALFVCHGVGPLFWEVAVHLRGVGERDAAQAWWDLARSARLHDVALLDQLLRVAAHGGDPTPRPLRELAARGAENSPEGDPQPDRRRHGAGEVVGEGPADVSYRVNLVLDAYRRLRGDADLIIARLGIDAGVVGRFGPLALGLQVQAAIAAHAASRDGLLIDEKSPGDVERWWKEVHRECSNLLHEDRAAYRCFKWADDRISLKGDGHLDVRESALRYWLDSVNDTLLDVQGVKLCPPMSGNGRKLSIDPNLWADRARRHVLLGAWVRLAGAAAAGRSLSGNGPGSRLVRPNFVIVPRLRTLNPNVELLGPAGRVAFAAPQAHYFVVGKLSGLAVRCLAEVCNRHGGASRLADRLCAGVDPALEVASSWAGFDRLEHFVGTEDETPGITKAAMARAGAFVEGLPRFWDAEAARVVLGANTGVRLNPGGANKYIHLIMDVTFPEVGALLEQDYRAVVNPVGRVRGAMPSRAQAWSAACLDLCDDVTKAVLFAAVDAGYTPVACAGEEFVVKVPENTHGGRSGPVEAARQVEELAERAGGSILESVPVRCSVFTASIWMPGQSAPAGKRSEDDD